MRKIIEEIRFLFLFQDLRLYVKWVFIQININAFATTLMCNFTPDNFNKKKNLSEVFFVSHMFSSTNINQFVYNSGLNEI